MASYESFDRSFHTAGFSQLPGTPGCCPNFTEGSGTGFAGGGILHWPLSNAFFLQLRAGYGSDDAILKSDEPTVFNLDGEAVPGLIHHEINARESFLSVEPQLGVFLWKGLHLIGGVWAGYVVSGAYDQSETLIEPSRGTFNNGLRTRNPSSGNIPDVSLIAVSAVGGIGWSFAFTKNNSVVLAPEITWRHQLTRIVSGLDWQRQSLSFGLSLLVALGGPTAVVRAPGPIDIRPDHTPTPVTTSPKAGIITASIEVLGTGTDGTNTSIRELHVEEFVMFEMQPLLHYVFFDAGSSQVPERYVSLSPEGARDFNLNKLQGVRVLDNYHNILNIVGSRMTQIPGASIRLVGCNSGQDDEAGNVALSRKRAEHVADYLANTWGIARDRMMIEARNLPEKPTTSLEGDGQAENRRVEILSADENILRPIMQSDTTQLPDPQIIIFKPRVENTIPIAEWRLKITDGASTLREFVGEGPVPATISWTVGDDWSDTFRSASRLTYTLAIEGTDGTRASAEGVLRTDVVTMERKRARRLADVEIDLYNLILFDFGSTILSDANRRLAGFIRGRIKPGAVVSITGYTDNIGDSRFNQKLSRDRAQATADELGIPNTTVYGIGEAEIHPNRLPEGRFYNRTVSVKVETPVRP